MLAQQILNGLVIGAVYSLFALGFNLIFGVHRILNLAHGGVVMVGAFAGLYAVLAGLPIWVAFIAAALAAGLLSVLIDFVAFRPLRQRGEMEFAALVSSIGADMVLTTLAQRWSNTQVMRFPFDAFPISSFTVFGLRMTTMQLSILGVVAAVSALLFVYLYGTSFGRQVRATAENDRAARLLGVNVTAVYFQTFFISGALAGLTGVLLGLAFNHVYFLMGEPLLLKGFVVLILGGLGSLKGALVAGFLLGIIQAICTAYLPNGLSDPVVYGLLFVIILLRPSGLFGDTIHSVRAVRQ